ncbi:MAG TPA: dihydroneopterin aldolase [Candidatus Thioglobus sp.]|jgi:dihydroneopterin aldolase|nr:dihydroneopterin aldolase [Candidatus Thioglobus sp.]HIL42575.1 dihydroneopterin aldolase [Gammaproteobacteria bacterium]
MDIIFIQGLKIDTVIGIYDWEREIRQEVVLDLEISTDIKAASETDNIEQTLSYKSVCKRLIDFVSKSEFQLVETLAERAARIVIEEFDVDAVKLTLNKGEAVTGAQGVGIIIERSKSSYVDD